MTFIETTPPESASDAVAAMYLRQQSVWGYIPNYAKAFCYRPEVLARWGKLLAEIRRPMEDRRFELVTFVTAYELGNSACAIAHGKALGRFFTDEQIQAIAGGRFDGILTRAEQAMVKFARQIAIDASQVTAHQIAALREHGYSDPEIFDIAAASAGRAFFAKLLDALGVELDSPFLALDESFRHALTVGRPIDAHACVTMPVAEPLHVGLAPEADALKSALQRTGT
jgi:uncharacterized peroxidase-related enzyme